MPDIVYAIGAFFAVAIAVGVYFLNRAGRDTEEPLTRSAENVGRGLPSNSLKAPVPPYQPARVAPRRTVDSPDRRVSPVSSAATSKSSSSYTSRRSDDDQMFNPLHPLSPLNPVYHQPSTSPTWDDCRSSSDISSSSSYDSGSSSSDSSSSSSSCD